MRRVNSQLRKPLNCSFSPICSMDCQNGLNRKVAHAFKRGLWYLATGAIWPSRLFSFSSLRRPSCDRARCAVFSSFHSQQRDNSGMQKLTWWERGVIYEVYPRSFQDSNGDGIGDLAGIRQRPDYLVSLGVAALWLSPIYPSPMADFGYDIADYCDIDPIFGTLHEFDALLEEVHHRGLKM